MPDELDLDALAEAVAKMTEGPWVVADWSPSVVITERWADESTEPSERGPWMILHTGEAEATGIVAIVNSAEQLIALARRSQHWRNRYADAVLERDAAVRRAEEAEEAMTAQAERFQEWAGECRFAIERAEAERDALSARCTTLEIAAERVLAECRANWQIGRTPIDNAALNGLRVALAQESP